MTSKEINVFLQNSDIEGSLQNYNMVKLGKTLGNFVTFFSQKNIRSN